MIATLPPSPLIAGLLASRGRLDATSSRPKPTPVPFGLASARIDSKLRLPKGASWIRSHGYPCRGGGHRDTSELTGIRDATAGTVRASCPEAEAGTAG